jgi:hypothetical protein
MGCLMLIYNSEGFYTLPDLLPAQRLQMNIAGAGVISSKCGLSIKLIERKEPSLSELAIRELG